MAEQTMTGVCTEIAQKPGNDWVEFHIDGGGEWPVRLSTKKQPLIELGRAVGQQLATWTYTEVESGKINEKSGKPYINRYLEAVEVGGTVHWNESGSQQSGPASPNATSTPSPTQSGPSHAPLIAGDKDRAITRMSVLKTTVELYRGALGPDVLTRADVDSDLIVIKIMDTARRFERWVYRDIQDEPFE